MEFNSPAPMKSRRSQPRVSQACQMCKIKKAKCGKTAPCRNCESHGWTCIYETNKRSPGKSTPGPKPGIRRGRPSPISNQLFQSPVGTARAWNDPPATTRFEATNSDEINVHDSALPTPYTALPDEGNWENEDQESASGEAQHEIGPLRDVNEHTTGREYYGRSSNFALLGQLFAHARRNLRTGENSANKSSNSESLEPASRSNTRTHVVGFQRPVVGDQASIKHPQSTSRLSIVNLLYDDETSVAEPNYKSTSRADGQESRLAPAPSTHTIFQNSNMNDRSHQNGKGIPDLPTRSNSQLNPPAPYSKGSFRTSEAIDNYGKSQTELGIEKEYLRLFFTNLHYIHPFLSQTEFEAKSELVIWSKWPLIETPRVERHFVALYNVILAVGSLTGSQDTFIEHKRRLDQDVGATHSDVSSARSSIQLSGIFFDRSKRFLGDCFEVCSLESAQTLILMSLYCQNALKPHACYMYSGMAVRTALAIGLPDTSMPQSMEWQKAARKTWWAIYSQEVDMCCSSGRMSSLMQPTHYEIPFPDINSGKDSISAGEPENVAMITEMVKFAALLLRVSKEVYHEAKHLSMLEKSKVAFELDACFTKWRDDLPTWLRSGSNPLKEPEWAGKQRIVLELRYQNARILLHRPFVAASAIHQSLNFDANIEACLTAARRTTNLLHESYLHRHYFRSWRYNSTYTIYAATIILYLILLDYNLTPTEDLLSDVQKSVEILGSMDEARAVRRCYALIQELLEFAQNHARQRQIAGRQYPYPAHSANSTETTVSSYNASHSADLNQMFSVPSQSNVNEGNWAMNPSMISVWASMMDPVALEGFVVSDDPIEGMVYDNSWALSDMMQ